MHKKYHEKFKILEILAVTTQAHEGIETYIADYLVAGYTRQIKVPYVSGVSVDTTQSNGFASKDNPDPDTRAWKQSQITYTDGLKAGDMVLVQKLNDNNKYVIIARVVEA